MSVILAACRKLASSLRMATIFLVIGTIAGAQVPSQDPLNALKNLTPEQQQSLIQSVLGGDGTNKKTDSKLNSPETVEKRDDRLGGQDKETKRGKTLDGRTLRQFDEDPELRADDTVLIDLTPVELVGANNNVIVPAGGTTSASSPPGANSATSGAAAAAEANGVGGVGIPGSTNNKKGVGSDFRRIPFHPQPHSPDQAHGAQ